MTAQLEHEQRYMLTLGPATVEDWLAADEPADGSRLELILGYLVMSPPPMSGHQRVSFRLARAVDDALEKAGLSSVEVLQTVGVRISTPLRIALSPDLVVVKVGDSRPVFDPSAVRLAVEIWSPGNRRGERETKVAAYAEAGIPHLWLVETPPGKPAVFCAYELTDAGYTQVVEATNGETVTAPGPVPAKIDTSQLR